MVKFDEVIRRKQLHIISLLYDVNQEIDSEYEAHKIIYDKLTEVREENELDNYRINLFVKDDSKRKWKQGTSDPNVFVKIFFNEISYVEKIYSLTRTEIGFLFSLSKYLLWEENLLVDKEGIPLNQKRLIKELGLGRNTVSKNIKSLEKKKCLIRIWDGREAYYLMNPYLMFFGEKVNKSLPNLFEIIDYMPLNKNNKKDL